MEEKVKRKRGRKGNLDSDNYNKVAGQNCFRWSSRIIRIRKWSMRKKKKKKKKCCSSHLPATLKTAKEKPAEKAQSS